MAKKKFAFAITGNGAVTEANAAALLDNYLPDELSGVYTTERVTRSQKGLKTAIAWMESEGLEIERDDDLIGKLTEHREQGHDVALLVVGTDDVDETVTAAHELGIVVKDLSAALDDVIPPEPESSGQDFDGDEPASVPPGLTHGPSPADRFTDAEVKVLRQFAWFLQSQQEKDQKTAKDEPPFDGPYTDPSKTVLGKSKKPARPTGSTTRKEGSKPYFVSEDGGIREARGRKRDTETKVFLSDSEYMAYIDANT